MLRDLLSLWVFVILGVPVLAGADERGGGESDGDEYHEHTVAFFVGAAEEGAREDGIAVGVEYEHRRSRRFGIGVLLEHTFGDVDTWVFAVPFAYHGGRWKVYAGPGVEDGQEDNETLLRVGGEYGFEVGDWEIAPQLDVDFVEGEETWILGVTFAKGM